MLGIYRAVTRVLEWGGRPALAALAGRGGDAWPGRSGRLPRVAGGLWIHAASAGEVRGIVPLARRLDPGVPLLVTAQTAAGIGAVSRHLPGALAARAPLDFPGVMRIAVDAAAPRALLIAETELWPNLVEAASEAGVVLALVNARISDRTIGRYRALRSLTAPLLRRMTAIAAQSPLDLERFIALGANPAAVRVTGNMKHDVPRGDVQPAAHPWGAAPIVTAGSLREGEEDIAAEALRRVAAAVPGIRIVAAPRHVHRRAHVGRAFHRAGFRVSLRSEGGPAPDDTVLVLDTMGELAGFYAVSRVALVGGTLLPFGGHNVIEPAALGIPVIHGPFVSNCRVEAEILVRNGGSTEVTTPESVARAFERYLIDDLCHRDAAAAALRTAAELSGATERTVAFLSERGAWS